ncbi:LysR substrate-binding domain-containing protein [Paraburkholderia sediminicola]|uniref:LysR substrate-binding domain-containing protein n=1 Tax=Paraburkholderia sediminicola TaxID=458836 RepID=UPI0038B814F0
MQLNPRQLEAFRKVMVTGSMTIAAEMLKISQPAVSRLIKDFEHSLGLRLFRREGNRLIPGAEALRLFSEVDRFYQGIEHIERVAGDLKALRTGTLRIASMTALGLSVLAEGVCRFSRSRPGVTTSLSMMPSLSILELTAANQVDVGFVQLMGGEYPGIDIIPFPAVEAVCVLPSTHALARKKIIRIDDLHGQPLISLSVNSPIRMRLEMAMDAAGVICERPVESTLAHSACRMVAGGLGLTVCDPFSATYTRYPGTVCRRLEPAVSYEVAMVLPAHQPRSTIVTEFMNVIRNLFKEEFIPQIDGKIKARRRVPIASR